MNDKILLTISILISNRPDTVEKCLQSLDSLRKNVPCELILTDTGCGEKVRGIIEKYADVILEFEWCRDFAKARNLGLDAARGEWFLYLDDDEWFEDTKEIEDFFNFGSWQKYGVALYLQRNYSNSKGTMYSDATVSRMARLNKGVRFQYSIHETFQNTSGPVKLFRNYVHHYGYIYKNNYERYKHSQRNLIPLLEEHKKAPQNLRHNAQLAQEYNGIGEDLKSIEISLQGIEDFCKGTSSISNLNSLFVNVVERYMHMYQYENVVSYAMKYIEDDRLDRLGVAKISFLAGKAFYELEQYKRCSKFCDTYLKVYDDYCKNEEWYIGRASLFLHNCFDKRVLHEVVCYNISAKLKLKEYSNIKNIFDYIDMESDVLTLDVVLLKSVVESFVNEKLTDENPCVYVLNKLLERGQFQEKIIEYFEEKRKENCDIAKDNSYKWNYLQGDCWYINYLKLTDESANKETSCENFDRLWDRPEKVLLYSKQLGVWEYAEKIGVELGDVIERIPYFKWKNAVIKVCKRLELEELVSLDQQINSLCVNGSMKKACWELCFIKKQLDEIEETEDAKEVVGKLERFSELSVFLASEVYKKDVIEKHPEMLPGDIQAAICLLKVFEYVGKNDYIEAIRLLREVKELLPSFATPLKVCTKWIERQIKQHEEEAQAAKIEMEGLERAVKAKIGVLMQNGEYTTALQLILQLESIVGTSLELDAWKELCNSRE